MAKRKADPHSRQTVRYKVKNPAYTQSEAERERRAQVIAARGEFSAP